MNDGEFIMLMIKKMLNATQSRPVAWSWAVRYACSKRCRREKQLILDFTRTLNDLLHSLSAALSSKNDLLLSCFGMCCLHTSHRFRTAFWCVAFVYVVVCMLVGY